MNFDEWFASFDAEGMLPMALLRKAFNDATAAEREECARICDERAWDGVLINFAGHCAAAIRARSEK